MTQLNRHRQTGMGKWGWLFTIILLVAAGTTALRIGPHYIDFEMVRGTFDNLPAERVHGDMSRNDIREHFVKQFRVEGFQMNVRDIVKIDRNREETKVTVGYEIREPLVYNADVVLTFLEERTFQ